MATTSKEPKQPHSTAPVLPAHVAAQYGLETTPPNVALATAASAANATEEPASLLDNPDTDAAVDAIVATESDAALGSATAPTPQFAPPRRSFAARVRAGIRGWWHHRILRWTTIIMVVGSVAGVVIVPVARYTALNIVGVRSTASLTVVDQGTQLPLKNVTVHLGGSTARTNIAGVAQFKGLRLGAAQLRVERLAFAPQQQAVTIGWGSNPLGTYHLDPTGVRYTVQVHDYVSGKPLEKVDVSSDGLNALTDKQGKALLTLETTEAPRLDLHIAHAGYRSETRRLDETTAMPLAVRLVPAAPALYVANKPQGPGVYASDADGTHTRLLLPVPGIDRSMPTVVASPDGAKAALISQKDDVADSDGYRLFSLTLIDIATGSSQTIDRAARIEAIDWLGDRLVYRATIAGASAPNAQRNRLVAYNVRTNAKQQLATANEFVAVQSAHGMLYYAPSGNDPKAQLGLFVVHADGSGRTRVVNQEVWSLLRTTYSTFTIQTPGGWFAYKRGAAEAQQVASQHAGQFTSFVDSPSRQQTAWVQVDGADSVLYVQPASEAGAEPAAPPRTLRRQPGVSYPLRWLSETTVLYTVTTKQETALYILSTEGGAPHKVVDIAPSYGFAGGF